MSHSLRLTWRAPLLLLLILGGIAIALTSTLLLGRHWSARPIGKRIIMGWKRAVAWCVDLKVQLHGRIHEQPTLLIANHISWLDIIGIGARIPTVFVAKSDVLRWPLIGHLARLSGTEFIDRNSPVALRAANTAIVKRIRAGEHVVFFAEGTTGDGTQVLPFKSGIFQLPIEHGIPLQTLALRYVRDGERDTVAPFIGDDGFVQHLLRIIAAGTTELRLQLGHTLCQSADSHMNDRHSLAQSCRLSISQQLEHNPVSTTPLSRLPGNAYDAR